MLFLDGYARLRAHLQHICSQQQQQKPRQRLQLLILQGSIRMRMCIAGFAAAGAGFAVAGSAAGTHEMCYSTDAAVSRAQLCLSA